MDKSAAPVSPELGIAHLLKPHWKLLTLGILAAIGEGATNLLEPWPLKIVLDNILQRQHIHGWLNHRILAVVGDQPMDLLRFATLAVLAIAAAGAVASYAEKFVTTTVGQWVMHDLRTSLYSHIQRLSLTYHDQKQTGDLLSRVTSDIDAMNTFITSGLLSTLINGLTLVGMVVVMFYINWRFTLVALAVAPILFAVVFTSTRRIKEASREVRKKEGQIVSVMQEVLGSIRVVRAFAQEDYEQRRLEEESLESVEIALRARRLKAKLVPLVEVIVACGTAMVLWFGTRMVMSRTLSAGSLIMFILYLGKMYKPMQELSKMTDAYSKAAVGYERIQEILETAQGVRDSPGAVRAPRFRGAVEFDHVTFGYEPDNPILRDVSFRIQPGTVVAVVGRTGAGKTTLVSLLARFYDPNQGAIRIDGRDIRGFRQQSLRRQIGFVLQENVLFHGTIWRNIAYGKPEAGGAEVMRAARLANAHEFIERLPQGYDTIVGERGVTLSGGQRQRIAIARAIIRDAPLLILDEPSSSLDVESEELVMDAMRRLMEGRTSIVIGHRLSTIRRANLILVIEDGRLVEQGDHDSLMKSNSIYAAMQEA
jgi:subfamily B ATP-binding cassette protein MsbA